MNMMAITEKVIILGIMMLIGYAVYKTGYVSKEVKDATSKLIVRIVLPCLIISSISAKVFKVELLGNILTVFALSVFCIFLLLFLGMLTAWIFKIPDKSNTIHKLMFTLGNVVFIGYPVISSVYGEEGFFYGCIYWILNDMFLWTFGIVMLTKNEQRNKKQLLKKLINPNTVTYMLAVVMFLFGIRLPAFADSAVKQIGDMTTPLSMVFIGMNLAEVDWKNAFKKWWIFILAPVKMILLPLVLIILFKLIGIDDMLAGVVVLQVAMPLQIVLSIVANEHDADSEYASVGMFVTTVLCLVTLPLVCYMIQSMM